LSADKALVTGASGFTGGHLCRKLVERGVRVRILARQSSKLNGLNEIEVEPFYCDLATDEIPRQALKGLDIVYHVAAVYRKEGLPEKYFYDVHVGSTRRLLEAARQEGIKRFVHVSTVGVQGNVKYFPAKETAPYNPGDVYQRSKMAGELTALEYFQKHAYPVTVIRPGAIYGPGDLRFLKLFRAIDKGLFWMIGNGENFYHLVYIDDLVNGILAAGEREEAVGEIFTIAGQEPILVKELVRLLAEILDRPLRERNVPVGPVILAANICQKVCRPLGIEPPLYPRRLDFFIKNRSFDISKARQVLGYEPQIDLRAGLACTAEWYRQQGYL
jgi:nucleoside-diphosphate-sugar epimerase